MGLLIRNTLAVLPSGAGHAVGRHDLYIEGSDIAGIDVAPKGFDPSEVIDGTRLLTIPGLVNAHTHSYMSIMRNAADELAFNDWFFGSIALIERHMEPEDSYWASLLSQVEMIRSGTTCFNDMEMHAGQTPRAVLESGMRAVVCRALTGNDYDRGDLRIAEALRERGNQSRVKHEVRQRFCSRAGADEVRCQRVRGHRRSRIEQRSKHVPRNLRAFRAASVLARRKPLISGEFGSPPRHDGKCIVVAVAAHGVRHAAECLDIVRRTDGCKRKRIGGGVVHVESKAPCKRAAMSGHLAWPNCPARELQVAPAKGA